MKKLHILIISLLTPFTILAQSEVYLEQEGSGNEVSIVQIGSPSAVVFQWGDQNEADIQQAGYFQTYSSTAQAGDLNYAFVRQSGDDIFATVQQNGNENTSYQWQDGGTQDMHVLQRGDRNFSYQSQNGGPFNRIETFQFGNEGTVYVTHNGHGHQSEVRQDSDVENSRVDHYIQGYINTAYASQYSGSDQHIDQNQNGGWNVSSIQQYGNRQYAFSNQIGEHNRSIVDQEGADNSGNIIQVGDYHFASANQHDTGNSFLVWQDGSEHTAQFFQFGSGNVANVEQYNSGNSAYFTQNGNNNTLSIYQE